MEQEKTTAMVAYLTIIGSVIAIFLNNEHKSNFASFHIRQGLGLNLSFFLLGYFISYFDSWMITSAFYLFFIILWFYGFSSALNSQMREVPILGRYFQQFFKNL